MENKELLFKIEINDFSEYIQKASKAREVPYIKGKCRLPKKYESEVEYKWSKIKWFGKNCEVRVRKSDGFRLISNSKTANKPRFVKVNGQSIYNQTGGSFGRAFARNILHDYFKPYLKDIKPITDVNKFPLEINLIFKLHDKGKSNIDNDNKWPWEKFFQDSLTENKIIPDDNCYIISKNSKETILIPDTEQQQLIIEVYGQRGN